MLQHSGDSSLEALHARSRWPRIAPGIIGVYAARAVGLTLLAVRSRPVAFDLFLAARCACFACPYPGASLSWFLYSGCHPTMIDWRLRRASAKARDRRIPTCGAAAQGNFPRFNSLRHESVNVVRTSMSDGVYLNRKLRLVATFTLLDVSKVVFHSKALSNRCCYHEFRPLLSLIPNKTRFIALIDLHPAYSSSCGRTYLILRAACSIAQRCRQNRDPAPPQQFPPTCTTNAIKHRFTLFLSFNLPTSELFKLAIIQAQETREPACLSSRTSSSRPLRSLSRCLRAPTQRSSLPSSPRMIPLQASHGVLMFVQHCHTSGLRSRPTMPPQSR